MYIKKFTYYAMGVEEMKIKNLRVFLENFAENAKYKLKGTKTGYPSIDKTHENGMTFLEKHPVIPSVSIYMLVKLLAMQNSDSYALDCDGVKIKYKEIMENADTIAKSLKAMGIKKNDIITVSMPNFHQGIELFLAANKIGATVTFLNSYAPLEEVKQYLTEFNSPLFVNYDKDSEYNKHIVESTNVKHVITLSKEDKVKTSFNSNEEYNGDMRYVSYSDLGKISKKFNGFISPFVGGKNDALILFTSGSTGKPKSVVLTNENVISAELYAKNTSHTDKTIKGTKTLVCVPYAYPYGFVTSALTSLLMGKEGILAPNLANTTIANYLAKKPNIIFGSPALLKLIMTNVPEDMDLSFVTHFISGGDFLTPQLYKRGKEFFAKHGAPDVVLGNGFGNAETVSIGSTPIGVPVKETTAGKILAGLKIKVVDPVTMEEKKYGEEGMLCLSGKLVFKEYYKNPQLTEDAKFTDKDGRVYFKTGTMGFVDEDGYFTVTARQSRFYIMSSLNKVYLDHVQGIISNYPWVKECAAVKVEYDDEAVNKIYIVLNDGYEVSEELLNQIKEQFKMPVKDVHGELVQLKEFEIPSFIEIVDSLPLIKGSEKVDYTLLENQAQEKHGKEKVFKK